MNCNYCVDVKSCAVKERKEGRKEGRKGGRKTLLMGDGTLPFYSAPTCTVSGMGLPVSLPGLGTYILKEIKVPWSRGCNDRDFYHCSLSLELYSFNPKSSLSSTWTTPGTSRLRPCLQLWKKGLFTLHFQAKTSCNLKQKLF